MAFPKRAYFSLENLDIRDYARRDSGSFLQECLIKTAIIDEIQRVPELLSYIQTIVDERQKEGLFILTGSQNFQLLHTIFQYLRKR